MVFHDSEDLACLELDELWDNYIQAMNLAIHHTLRDDRDQAIFYIAVQRITLDHYFDEIERNLCSPSSLTT